MSPHTPIPSPVPGSAAVDFFERRLRFETDPSDVVAALETGERIQLVDVRSASSWDQGHARAAVHIPRHELAGRALGELDPEVPVVVYCWGPACNGGVKGALELARLGFAVREMIGGFEYWAREGLPVDSASGDATREPDPLVAPAPASAVRCAC